MSDLGIALSYARRKKEIRLNQNKIYRRKIRVKWYPNLGLRDPSYVRQSLTENISSMNMASFIDTNFESILFLIQFDSDCGFRK